MKKKITNSIRTMVAMVLVMCLTLSSTMMTFAASDYCGSEEDAKHAVTAAVDYCDKGKQIVDLIVSLAIDGEYADMFEGSNTSSLVKGIAIDMIVDELDNNEQLMKDFGFEPTDANKELVADELYYVACVYYDELHSSGGTRESASKLSIIELIRFALVEAEGYTESNAVETSKLYFELNEVYMAQGEQAAIDKAMSSYGTAHTFGNPVWSWNEDFSKATAAFTCSACGDVETVEATVETKSVDADCTTNGEVTANASVTFNGTTYTDTKTEIIPGEHKYEDGICSLCGDTLIKRYSGENRYETSFAIADALKAELGVDKFDNIVLASGKGFADALAGSYLASVKKAPILISNGKNAQTVSDYVVKNLSSNGVVYILGGTSALPQNVEDVLTSNGVTVKRLAGDNRYDTNLAILNEAGVNAGQEILISSGKNFPDALSASATGLPILMVGKSLSAAQKEFLSNTSGDFVIIGGTSAVSETVEGALAELGEVERIAGDSRYKTSIAVAERFFDGNDEIVLAFGKNFPDGLCGGPLANAMGAPLVLTGAGSESVAAAYCEANGIVKGAALGGASVLSDTTIQLVFNVK